MSPQSIDPNPDYIRVPITDERLKRPGAIILWSGIACPVERVTPIGSLHTCINYRFDGMIRTGTFSNEQHIHVKRTAYDSIPITDERIAIGTVFQWNDVECTVLEKSARGKNYTHIVYRHSDASWDATLDNSHEMLVKRTQEGGESDATKSH